MTQTSQKENTLESTTKKQVQYVEMESDQLSQYVINDEDANQDEMNLEEIYLIKLKTQRKRIEDLSDLYSKSCQNYEKQVIKTRQLEAKLQFLESNRSYQSRVDEINIELTSTRQQNIILQQNVQDLKQQLSDILRERDGKIQRLTNEINQLKKKDSYKIQQLEDKLAEKEEEIERLLRVIKNKDKQYDQLTSSFNSKLNKTKDDYEEKLKFQQKKFIKFQIDFKSKGINSDNFASSFETLSRENDKLKDENYKLKRQLQEKDCYIQNLLQNIQGNKSKINSLKKEMRSKEKQYQDLKLKVNNIEKYKKQHEEEVNQIKCKYTSIINIKTSLQSQLHKKQSELQIERRNFTLKINDLNQKVSDLFQVKQDLLSKIKHLQTIIKKKENAEKQRKTLLKNEMKQIDRLEKVIDRIVE